MTETLCALVVDEPSLRQQIEPILRQEGYSVLSVQTGADLLALPEGHLPSLVFLDQCSSSEHLQLLRQLRAHPSWKHVLVLMIACDNPLLNLEPALEAGADDFLCKPFHPSELVARVRALVRLRHSIRALAQREENLAVVLELTQMLSSGANPQQILQQVAIRIAEVTRVNRVAIVLTSESEKEGWIVASNDVILRSTLDLTLCSEVMRTLRAGSPILMEPFCNSSVVRLFQNSSEREDGSSAILPLKAEQRLLGGLIFQSSDKLLLQGHLFSLAQTIASALALALRNARKMEGLLSQHAQVSQAHQEAERRLQSVEPYARLFEHAADGIVAFEHTGHLLFANPKALEICGAVGKQVSSLNLNNFLLEDEYLLIKRLRKEVLAGKHPHGVDLKLRRLDGLIIVVNAAFSMLEEGIILATFRDVTSERMIQSELRKTTGFLESVIESSADGIISADLKGRVLLFNRAAERCTGYDSQDIIGKYNIENLYPTDVARKIMHIVRDKGGRAEGIRSHLLSKTGELIPVMASVALLYEDEVAVGSVGVFSDLRERLRIETKLSVIQEELKLRERQSLVAELAGAAAHELNQPLTSVMAYAELLKRKLSPESPSSEAVNVILGEASRMAEIIRKIGTIARYETKSYVGQAKILDLERSSRQSDPITLTPPSSTVPPSSPRSTS